jgi:hypothetical protein
MKTVPIIMSLVVVLGQLIRAHAKPKKSYTTPMSVTITITQCYEELQQELSPQNGAMPLVIDACQCREHCDLSEMPTITVVRDDTQNSSQADTK